MPGFWHSILSCDLAVPRDLNTCDGGAKRPCTRAIAACPRRLASKEIKQALPSFELSLSAGSLIFTQLLLSGWVEGKRWADLKNPGSQGDGSFLGITSGFKPVSNGYPGKASGPCATCHMYVMQGKLSHDDTLRCTASVLQIAGALVTCCRA